MSSFVAGCDSSTNPLRTLDSGTRSPKGRRAVPDVEILIYKGTLVRRYTETTGTERLPLGQKVT